MLIKTQTGTCRYLWSKYISNQSVERQYSGLLAQMDVFHQVVAQDISDDHTFIFKTEMLTIAI